MSKALVIGSEGNVGTRLVEHLRHVGWDVLESDILPRWRPNYLIADIGNPLDLIPAFDWKPDVVFLLAAAVGRTVCEQAPSMSIQTNLAGVNNVLQLCRRSDCKIVFFSSSEVYGPVANPMDEATTIPQPNNRYGLSKWLGEHLVEYEVRHAGLRAVTLRPCMIYDEKEQVGEHRSAMIRFASNLARGRAIQVHRGSQRGWLHVLDAVRGIEAAARVEEYAAINIGHPRVMPMLELAEMIAAELDVDPSLIEISDLPTNMTLVKYPALARQRELLHFEPRIDVEEGVRRVCALQARMAAAECAAAHAATNAAPVAASMAAPVTTPVAAPVTAPVAAPVTAATRRPLHQPELAAS